MADRLRLLFVLGASTGGIGRHVHTVVTEMVRRGHDVTVCAPEESEQTFGWSAVGAEFVAAPLDSLRPMTARKAVRRIRVAAADRDVVHAHGTRAGALAVLSGHPRVIVSWHNAPIGGGPRRLLHALLERLTVRRAALVLAASEDLAERARRSGGKRVRFAAVTAPTLPAATQSPEAVRAGLGVGTRPVVLAVARLAPQKRLDLLVRATAGWAVDPAGPVVLVAGDGPLGPELEAMAAEVRSPLRLLGHRDDIGDLMACADVAVLSSDWEARPLVAQEALRIGVALVATDVGGVAGLVGDAAVLVPAGDATALGAALRDLLDDPARRAHNIRLGLQQALTWPGVEEMVDELETSYAEVRDRG